MLEGLQLVSYCEAWKEGQLKSKGKSQHQVWVLAHKAHSKQAAGRCSRLCVLCMSKEFWAVFYLVQTYCVLLYLYYFALLYFADTAFFNKLKVCGNQETSKSFSTFFPTAFVQFVSLCPIWVTLKIFQTFSLLLYLQLVIFDVTVIIVLGAPNCAHRQ